jgi:hypothetical protein
MSTKTIKVINILNILSKLIIVSLLFYDRFTFYTNHIVINSPTNPEITKVGPTNYNESETTTINIFDFYSYNIKTNNKENPHFLEQITFFHKYLSPETRFKTYFSYDLFILSFSLLSIFKNSLFFPILIIIDSFCIGINMIATEFTKIRIESDEAAFVMLVRVFARVYPILAGSSFKHFFQTIYWNMISFIDISLKIFTIVLAACSTIFTFVVNYVGPEVEWEEEMENNNNKVNNNNNNKQENIKQNDKKDVKKEEATLAKAKKVD